MVRRMRTTKHNGIASACTFFALTAGVARAQSDLDEWATDASRCGCKKISSTATYTIRVPAGGSLQSAIDKAQPGAHIVLARGATYYGNFILPKKSGDSYITIRTDGVSVSSCERMTPGEADEENLATIVSPGWAPAFKTAAGAHHWRLLNLEVRGPKGKHSAALIELGTGLETSTSQLPRYLILDRLYIHGDRDYGGKRGVSLNSGTAVIQNSWFNDFKHTDKDTQAIAGWNGTGEWTIANNMLRAAGENILIGGTDPRIDGLVPANIRIRFNHIEKSRTWRPGDSSYAGTHWMVKNLLELKNARAVTVEGNLFEHHWADAQKGYAIVLTPRNQNDTAPWTQVSGVLFRRNVVRHVAAGINILGHDDQNQSYLTKDITIKDNLFYDVGGTWGGSSSQKGRLFMLVSGTNQAGPSRVTIDHNTALQGNYYLLGVGGDGAVAKPDFVFKNNIVRNNYGVHGDGAGSTASALRTNFPDAVFTKNALIGGSSSSYPDNPGNYFPSSDTSVRFIASGNYELSSTSPYNDKGTDGRDLGANFNYLDEASQCE
jgi:hypothetical protein